MCQALRLSPQEIQAQGEAQEFLDLIFAGKTNFQGLRSIEQLQPSNFFAFISTNSDYGVSEELYYLALPAGHGTIQEALNSYESVEREGHANFKTTFSSASDYLILSRQEIFIETGERVTTPVVFSEDFKFCSSIYSLYAVVLHSGKTRNSGHYVCFAKKEDEWYQFNDAIVTNSSQSEVFRNDTFSNWSLLFYERQSHPPAPITIANSVQDKIRKIKIEDIIRSNFTTNLADSDAVKRMTILFRIAISFRVV